MSPQRTTPDGQPLYKCSRCKDWKLADAYSKCATRPRGLSPRCKECDRVARATTYAAHKDANRARCLRWSQANRDYKNAKARERYALDPERYNKKNRLWYHAHKEVAKAYNAAHPRRWRNPNYWVDYRTANLERLQSGYKLWSKTESGRAAIARSSSNRRARESQTLCDLTEEQWRRILRLQEGRCGRCACSFGPFVAPHRDHIIPISAGGNMTLHNVQALCGPCNAAKGVKQTDYRSPQMREAIARYGLASPEESESA